MAVVTCPQCDRNVPKVATNCPHCRHPLSKRTPYTSLGWVGWTLVLIAAVGILLLPWIRDGQRLDDLGTEDVRTAHPEQAEVIGSAIGKAISRQSVYTVRSRSHDRAYYVGACIQTADGQPKIALWFMTGSRSDPYVIWSVNRFAHDLTGFFLGADTESGGRPTDPEAKILRRLFRDIGCTEGEATEG